MSFLRNKPNLRRIADTTDALVNLSTPWTTYQQFNLITLLVLGHGYAIEDAVSAVMEGRVNVRRLESKVYNAVLLTRFLVNMPWSVCETEEVGLVCMETLDEGILPFPSGPGALLARRTEYLRENETRKRMINMCATARGFRIAREMFIRAYHLVGYITRLDQQAVDGCDYYTMDGWYKDNTKVINIFIFMALCCLRLGRFAEGLSICDRVIRRIPT